MSQSTLARQQERKQERLRGAGAREITRKRSGFDLAPATVPQPAPALIQIPPSSNPTTQTTSEGRRRSTRLSTSSATPDVEDNLQGSATKRRRLDLPLENVPSVTPDSNVLLPLLDAEELNASRAQTSVVKPRTSSPEILIENTIRTSRSTHSPNVTQVETSKLRESLDRKRRSPAIANQTPETRGKRTRQPSPDKFLTPSVLRNKNTSIRTANREINTPTETISPLRSRRPGFELLARNNSLDDGDGQGLGDESLIQIDSPARTREASTTSVNDLENSAANEEDEIFDTTNDSIEGDEGFVAIVAGEPIVSNPVIDAIKSGSRRRSSRLQSPLSVISDRVQDISLAEGDSRLQEATPIPEDEIGNDTSILDDLDEASNHGEQDQEDEWEGEPEEDEVDEGTAKTQGGDTRGVGPHKSQASKKPRQPRNSRNNDDYIPITVHRLKATDSFKNRYAPGVTAVDVVAQLIRDKILRAVNTVERRYSADITNEERKLVKRQKNALILFDEDVGGRLTRHAEVLDNFHSLRNEVRIAEREKVSLRNQLLELRKDREAQARQMDDVRKGHELKADGFSKILKTNNTLLELVTLAKIERSKQQAQISVDEIVYTGLEGIIKLVAEDLCSNTTGERINSDTTDDSLNTGMLQKVKDFNAYLEKANKVLSSSAL